MRAIVQDKYGSPDVLELREVDNPVVKDDEVLVRVRAAAVNIGDWHLVRGIPYAIRTVSGLRGPKRETPGLGVGQRCVWRRRHVRRADRQVVRAERDRRLWHE